MRFFSYPRWGAALAHLPDYLGNHVRVSIAALALGLAVSLPLAIAARNRPVARGALLGLTRGTGRAQIVRATLEAIAYQTVDAVRAQEAASGKAISALRADGGAVVNEWLMQFQADALGAPVTVPEIAETTALGAAYLAGIATGVWDQDGVAAMWRERATYEPRISADERESLLDRWHEAVERSRGWAR